MRGIVFGKITLKGSLNSVAASVAVRIEKDRHREQIAQHVSCNLLIYLGGTIRQPPSHGRSHWFNPSTAYHENQGVKGHAVTPFSSCLWIMLVDLHLFSSKVRFSFLEKCPETFLIIICLRSFNHSRSLQLKLPFQKAKPVIIWKDIHRYFLILSRAII